MQFTNFDFVPPDGLRDTSVYPDTPVSSAAAREQFQGLYDQLKSGLNTLMELLSGENGGNYIGNEVDGLDADTVKGQIEELLGMILDIEEGIVPDGSITNAKLAADVKIGSLASLASSEKSSVTAAINDVCAKTVYRPYVLTSSTTFTAPATGVYKVTAVGGGAGGCSANGSMTNKDYAAPGGASGGTAIKWVNLTKGQQVSVTVGSGGRGGNTNTTAVDKWFVGEAGGTTSFGSYCYATGGEALSDDFDSAAFFASGKPGRGVGGDINIDGKRAPLAPPRRKNTDFAITCGFPGADSYLGTGGYCHYYDPDLSTIYADGISGSGYGSGGGGSFCTYQDCRGSNGGRGADGVCIVEYFGYAAS